MFVCLCNGYRDTDIRKAVHEGGVSCADDAYQALGSGFCCGACKDFAEDIVSEELPKRVMIAAE